MSYQLYFWKQSANVNATPLETVEAISNGEEPQYLERINIEALLIDIFEQWPEHEKSFGNDGQLSQVLIEFKDSKSCVVLDWSLKHLFVESHSAPGEELNTFIDLAAKYECPLFDPQTNQRYVG